MEKKNWTKQDYIHKAFQNGNLIDQLWCDEYQISSIVEHAVQGCSVNEDNSSLNICCDYFIDYISVYLIKKPSDFLYLFKEFKEKKDKTIFMNLYFQNYLINPILIDGLLKNCKVIEQIGEYQYWIEYPLKYRATKLINNAQIASLKIEDLYPTQLQIPEEIKDYLLSLAYVENKLTEKDIEYYQTHFERSYKILSKAKQK